MLLIFKNRRGYEVIEALDSLDREIQKNLKIISYDDNRWLDYLKYPVSVICQPVK
jgi:LacI family transcriptional regulator